MVEEAVIEEKNQQPETTGTKQTEEPQEEEPQTSVEETEPQPEDTSESAGAFLNPGYIMLVLAIALDIISFIPILNILAAIIGTIFIGGWTLFRSHTASVTKGTAKKLGKVSKWAKRMKWLRPLVIVLECIPLIGALPCWTILVYFELQNE